MKKIMILTSLVFLTSCVSNGLNIGIGGWGGSGGASIGTSISFPIGGGGKSSTGINVIEQQIITYFSTDNTQNKASDTPDPHGYFRVLIDKKGRNQWIVQDFYQSNKARRTDPILIDAKTAYLFSAHPQNGEYVIYDINGKIKEISVFKDGKVIQRK